MLRFKLFGIPIAIQPFFWVIAVVLNRTVLSKQDWMVELAVWVGIVFLGVLAHELGHAFAGRLFGQVPIIELHGMGGATSWVGEGRLTPGRRVVVSFAGPAVGIAIGIAALVVASVLQVPEGSRLSQILVDVIWVNLGWGVINLIPMLPLDGGQIMTSVFELTTKNTLRARLAGHLVSLLVAVGLGVLAYAVFPSLRSPWNLILVALFAWSNLQAVLAIQRHLRKPPPFA